MLDKRILQTYHSPQNPLIYNMLTGCGERDWDCFLG